MSKDKISDYSSTADSNTDVGGIGIKGTDPVHNMDNGLREIMSHLADMNEGTAPLSDAFSLGAQSDEVSGLDKQVRFDASGVTKGEKRVLKVPDTDGTIVVSDDDGALLVADSEGNAVDLDAASLDGNSSSHYLDAANLTGTVSSANLPSSIDADITGNAATATNATDHVAQIDNPHNVTKTQIALGNVDNISDADKPISTATQTALDSKADVTALSTLVSADGVQTLSDTQKKQILANLGLVNNRVVKHLDTPHYYAASADRHIDVLDTSIVTSSMSSKVLIQVQISFERVHEGMFYLTRNGEEIGSAQEDGPKSYGLAPVDYDASSSATLTQTNFFYEDKPNSTGVQNYQIWIRGESNVFALNRTISDSNTTSHERATSAVMLTESL